MLTGTTTSSGEGGPTGGGGRAFPPPPPTPQGQGLLASLREYVQRLREQSGLDVRLEAADHLRFPEAVEAQVIRIVQEALTHGRKHARACTRTVRFAPQ